MLSPTSPEILALESEAADWRDELARRQRDEAIARRVADDATARADRATALTADAEKELAKAEKSLADANAQAVAP